MVRVSGITPSSSDRVLLPTSGGMAGSGRFLASIPDKSIHLPVFEKMLKGNVSFEHFMFLIVLLSSNTKRYGSKTEAALSKEKHY